MKRVSDETREEDERLRKELENVDLEKLKQAIKPLVVSDKMKPIKNKSA